MSNIFELAKATLIEGCCDRGRQQAAIRNMSKSAGQAGRNERKCEYFKTNFVHARSFESAHPERQRTFNQNCSVLHAVFGHSIFDYPTICASERVCALACVPSRS